MYEIIRSHPTVRELYARRLAGQGIISREEADAMMKEALDELDRARREATEHPPRLEVEEENALNGHQLVEETPPPVSEQQLITFNQELLTWPENFEVHPRLARTLQRRANALGADGSIDWGHAEALAFASILAGGTPIRLTGQDAERGTFSHRHAVLHSQDGKIYIPLQHLAEARASFSIYNSPLSETSALGFEYGYSVHAPDALVLWEAQYGDFANVAQVIIDQFISSGRAKWRQPCSLVLLLPHGYEGQGPEHSSARLERYLQLAADDNWRVANCSTAAQYFHLLRLQAFYLERYPRPLVLMTPKSLLRHPLAAARLQDLTQGSFQPVIDDEKARSRAEQIRRVVLCTGKIAIDLLSQRGEESNDIAIVRVELLYPFPREALQKVLAGYPRLREVIWVQEEPHNMGAWSYMYPHLTDLVDRNIKLGVVSRPDHASPAAGFWDLHEAEQKAIIAEATGAPLRQPGGSYVR
jgi:2-oxoglutarate dehydrogenase E1 component